MTPECGRSAALQWTSNGAWERMSARRVNSEYGYQIMSRRKQKKEPLPPSVYTDAVSPAVRARI